MKILFVHQNFPGQYLHLARHLVSTGNEVVAVTQRKNFALPGVKTIVYEPNRTVTPNLHHYLVDTEMGVLNGQAVLRSAINLKQSGFVPDVMLGHNGWGEIWYLKEVFPDTPLIGYFEFFYHLRGADIGFDPAVSVTPDTAPRIRTKNLGNLLGLDVADLGQCPTQWQANQYPERYRSMLQIVHEGIDTEYVAPDSQAKLSLPQQDIELKAGDEILTYVSRNLEPYRGFPQFMRSLPAILQKRPNARVIIVGGDETSYGFKLPEGQTYRQLMQKELGDAVDWKRVYFLGKVPYSTFRTILQVSRAHVYLTYPFVLSWSMLEAMAAGCLVIGSGTPPVKEAIEDGKNGVLTDFFDIGTLSEKIVHALAHPDDYIRIRQQARQSIIERYDLKTICLPAQIALVRKAMANST